MEREEQKVPTTLSPVTLSLYGPAGLTSSPSTPFITSPYSIGELLKIATTSPNLDTISFLTQLLSLLGQSSCNPVLFLQKNTPSYLQSTTRKDFDILSAIIEIILSSSSRAKSDETSLALHKLWIKLFKVLLASSTPSKQHYEKIYELLSSVMASCNKPGETSNNVSTIFSAVKLIRKMAMPCPSSAALSHFYFVPNDCSLSSVIPPNTLWPFHKGFTIMMWLKADDLSKIVDTTPVLMRLRSSAKGFECYITNHTLNYRIVPIAYTKPSNLLIYYNNIGPDSNGIAIGELSKDKWQFLAISHDRTGNLSKLYFFLGTEERQYVVDYPKFPEDATFLEQVFFENFSGVASSVLIYAHPIPSAAITNIAASFPMGLHDVKHIDTFSALSPSNKYCAWTTLRTVGNTIHNIYDGAKGITAVLTGSSGVNIVTKDSRYLDPIHNIVPFFHLVPLLDVPLGQKLLNLSLNLSCTYLSNLRSTSFMLARFQKECKCFVRTLGLHLLRFNPMLPNEETIKYMSDLMLIDPSLQRAVLKMLMDTINFWLNIKIPLLPLFWETLKANFACAPKEYSSIINIPIILQFMESMDLSLQKAACCDKHSEDGITMHYSLGVRYENMRSLLKFLIINDSTKSVRNLPRIVHTLEQKPCPCLFLSLITLLKDICEGNSGYTIILCKMDGVNTILKTAQSYPVDVKVACISFAAIALEQLTGNPVFEVKGFKLALVHMLGDPSVLTQSIKLPTEEAKLPKEVLPARRATSFTFIPSNWFASPSGIRKFSAYVEKPNLVQEKPKKFPMKRANSFSEGNQEIEIESVKNRETMQLLSEREGQSTIMRSRFITEDAIHEAGEEEEEEYKSIVRQSSVIGNTNANLLFPEDIKDLPPSNPFLISPPPKLYESSPILLDSVHPDLELLYSAILLWLVGGRPEQALSLKRNSPILVPSQKPSISDPQVLPIFLSLVKRADSEDLLRRCLTDLITLAEANDINSQQMLSSTKLSKWLVLLESHWYGRLSNYHHENRNGLELLCAAFRLHSTILCEGLQSPGGIESIVKAFTLWSYAIQPGTEAKARRNASVGSIRDATTVENSWACLKYLWLQILQTVLPILAGNKNSGQIPILIETTLNLLIGQNFKKGQGVKIAQPANPFSAGTAMEDPLAPFRVSDQMLIEAALEITNTFCKDNSVLLVASMFAKVCKEQALDNHIQLLEAKREKTAQLIGKECGHTNFAALLLNIGIRNADPEDIGKWLIKAEKLARYLGLISEYAYAKGNTRVARNECKNLLLVIATLAKEYCLGHKTKTEAYIKAIEKTLASILLYILQASESMNAQMKEFVRKTLNINRSKNKAILDTMHKFFNTNAEEYAALLGVEYKLFYSANSNFVKALERVSDASLEILNNDFKKMAEYYVSKKREAKSKAEKAKLKSKLPSKETYRIPSEVYKEETLSHLLRNQVKIAKWMRKWIKTQKRLKQWQGAWRDRSLFDVPENISRLPLKLSGHMFTNGTRCLMKIRCKKTDCVLPGDFPESSLDLWKREGLFELLSSITLEQNEEFDFSKTIHTKDLLWGNRFLTSEEDYSDSIAQIMYKALPGNSKELVTAPVDCELYTPLYAKKGKVWVHYSEAKGEYYIKFVISKEKKQKEDERLMFDFNYKCGMKIVKRWKVKDIKIMYKKYIVEQKSALEIAFSKGKSVLYNFMKEEERDTFCAKLLKLKEKVGNKIDCLPKPGKLIEKTLMENWINWKISSFDYLMTLNNLSGRSFHNVSQYPVFPWTIENVSTPSLDFSHKSTYRDMSKNVGMLGDKSRAEDFKSRYELDDLTGLGKFHFGSHYSNPGIVFQYLMRIFPFVEAYIKFFSGLDDPNRMFHSIMESLASAKRDPSDVRELIPEFFTFPEMFLNRECFHFGQREDDQIKVNDVILPPWAKGSPYEFVTALREALESDYTSQTLNKWVDLIFGYQQQGKEAEKAFNVFPRLSYDPGKILTKASGTQKDAFRMQAYHWGQTPIQLLGKKHPERLPKNPEAVYSILDQNARPNAYTPEIYKEKPLGSPKHHTKYGKVIKIFTSEDPHKDPSFTLVTLDGTLLDYVIEFVEPESKHRDQPKVPVPWFVDSAPKKYQNHYFTDGILLLDPSIETNFPVVLVKKHTLPHLAQGGYVNGNIQLTQLGKSEKSLSFKAHKNTVTCLEIDKEEKLAISGSITGEVGIYEIEDNMQWTVKKQLWDHGDAVTHIWLSDEMQLFCTSGADGYVNLYSYSGNLLRKFGHPQGLPIQYTVLGQNPLPCLLMCSKEDGTIYAFSLNGELMYKDSDTTKNVIGVSIGRDSNFADHLVYIKDRDFILAARKLPMLERRMLAVKKRATTFALFENQKMAVIGDEAGGFAFIWDPRSIPSNQSKPLLIP